MKEGRDSSQTLLDRETDSHNQRRRRFLKSLGAATGSAAALVYLVSNGHGSGGTPTTTDGVQTDTGRSTGGPYSEQYDVISVVPGNVHQIVLDAGETLSNKLIDITAKGADFRVVAKHDDWAIRNIGVRGQSHRGGTSVGTTANHKYHFYLGGSGTFENVYLGDGSGPRVRKGAILAMDTGRGHLSIRNVHIAEFAGIGIYAAGGAEGVRPTLGIENSYFRDNGNTHLRLAEQGSYIEDSVVHNTGQVPLQPSGAMVSRGFWPWRYGDPSQTVEIRDCQLDFATQGKAIVSTTRESMSRFHCIGGNIRGPLVGPQPDQIELTNVGKHPNTEQPSGVPSTPVEAASGEVLGVGF